MNVQERVIRQVGRVGDCIVEFANPSKPSVANLHQIKNTIKISFISSA
jgi:hypothetical protein